MFIRKSYKINDISVSRIGHENGAYMEIIPELGAMVYQICLGDGSPSVYTILKNDSHVELSENPWFRGRILFPFNDRIPGGKYKYDDIEYQLPINSDEDNSSIHGLVYNRVFTESECELSDNSAKISFVYTIGKQDFISYPFSVELKVSYTITQKDFAVSYTVRNIDERTLPVALGWHPYFFLSSKVDELALRNDGKSYVEVDGLLNPTGEIKSLSATALDFSEGPELGGRELDIALTAAEDGRTFLKSKTHQLEIYFDPSLFPYTQFFIPPDRESIAIEPITGATNSFNIEGLGRIDLTAGEERRGSVKISLNRLA